MSAKHDLVEMFYYNHIAIKDVLEGANSILNLFENKLSRYQSEIDVAGRKLDELKLADSTGAVRKYIECKNLASFADLVYKINIEPKTEGQEPEYSTAKKMKRLQRLEKNLDPDTLAYYKKWCAVDEQILKGKLDGVKEEMKALEKDSDIVKAAKENIKTIRICKADSFLELPKLIYQAKEGLYVAEAVLSLFSTKLFNSNTDLPPKRIEVYQRIDKLRQDVEGRIEKIKNLKTWIAEAAVDDSNVVDDHFANTLHEMKKKGSSASIVDYMCSRLRGQEGVPAYG